MNPTTIVRFVALWAKILSLTLLILVPPVGGGCATLLTQTGDFNEELLQRRHSGGPFTSPRMYSGIWIDMIASHPHNRGPFSGPFIGSHDFPFSLFADTVLLPLTAYEQIRYGSFGDDAPPLILAARDGDETKVRALVEQGTAVDVRTKGGLTALMVAAGWGRTPVAHALLKKGADVNAKTSKGWTALFAATKQSDTTMIQVLLDHGADIHATDTGGRTALWYADHHNADTEAAAARAVELLKRAGAKQ